MSTRTPSGHEAGSPAVTGGAAALAGLGLVLASHAGVAGGPGSVGGKIVYSGKGSKAQLLNSDAVLHNVHGVLNGKRDAFNVAMPTNGMKVKKKLRKPGLVKIGCDAGHTWMSA